MADEELKEVWKATGKSLAKTFTIFGKAVVKSVDKGVEVVHKWANEEEKSDASGNDSGTIVNTTAEEITPEE